MHMIIHAVLLQALVLSSDNPWSLDKTPYQNVGFHILEGIPANNTGPRYIYAALAKKCSLNDCMAELGKQFSTYSIHFFYSLRSNCKE